MTSVHGVFTGLNSSIWGTMKFRDGSVVEIEGVGIVLFVCKNVIPRSEKEGTKPPYVCPGCSNHTHGNN
jgi:hypothetical protein